jgi:hypothetical protein
MINPTEANGYLMWGICLKHKFEGGKRIGKEGE